MSKKFVNRITLVSVLSGALLAVSIGEYTRLEVVALLAFGIAEHGPAFGAWASYVGTSDTDGIERFTDVYRGEWDSMCTDADAAFLLNTLPNSRDIKIPRATHLMHLEENRYALYREAEAFLKGH